jgi:hypothetical protein
VASAPTSTNLPRTTSLTELTELAGFPEALVPVAAHPGGPSERAGSPGFELAKAITGLARLGEGKGDRTARQRERAVG